MAANYKCTSVGCYSVQSPETNALFQRLQTLINQFASASGIAPIGVDGIIGKGTTQAALVVLESLIDSQGALSVYGAQAAQLDNAISTPDDLAASAQGVVDLLSLIAQAPGNIAVSPPAPLPAPSPQPSATQIATTSANKPTSANSQAAQAKLKAIAASKNSLSSNLLDRFPPWASYAGGAVLALGAIFAVMGLSKKRAGSGAMAPAGAVAGYRRRY